MKTTRRRHSATFKAQVAIEAIKERESLHELAKRFEIHPQMITKWKQEFLKKSATVFDNEIIVKDDNVEQERLYSKIGQLEMEVDFLKKNLKKLGL